MDVYWYSCPNIQFYSSKLTGKTVAAGVSVQNFDQKDKINLVYDYQEVSQDPPQFSNPPVSVNFTPSESNNLNFECDPDISEGALLKNYEYLSDIITILSDSEEESSYYGSEMEDDSPNLDDTIFIEMDELTGEDEATATLINTIISNDNQHLGEDQATLELVNALRKEEN